MTTEYVNVGPLPDHPVEEIRTYDVPGRGVAVASTCEGWFAIDDECMHRQCSLGQGDLVGITLTCPCHFGVYDVRTGKVLDGPPPAPLRTYPVEVVDGQIRVGLRPVPATEDR